MDQGKEDRLGQPLEVDGCCGKQGLDFRVFKAASGGSGHSVQGFGQPMGTLDPPAMAGVEVVFCGPPSQSLATGAQHVNMVFGDMDAACGAAIRDALRPQRASPAGVWSGAEPAAWLCRRARGHQLFAGAADDVVQRVIAEPLHGKALGIAGSRGRTRRN